MDLTQAVAAKMAHSVPLTENDMRIDLQHVAPAISGRTTPVVPSEVAHRSSGYGLPCAKCRLYYAASLDVCPTCNAQERISPNVVAAVPIPKTTLAPALDEEALEQEREAFLREFKSQLFAAHTEVATSPVLCSINEQHSQAGEVASICRPCYDRLQERLDVCEAALHIDLKDAAQIIYDAVWADPSDPSKTYTNAASALLTELRKRAGISSMMGAFQPLGN